ncbi:MAG: hypothetical protein OXC54_06320 [Rhodospirillaceae bacterium]|nr:hypothetical protein [Rhodospirillaceae bacterium]
MRELFAGDGEVAMFYFAGPGFIETAGGYPCAGDCRTGDDGLSLAAVMTLANKSNILNRVIVLDSCHSSIAGTHPTHDRLAELADGMTVLSASTVEPERQAASGLDIPPPDPDKNAIFAILQKYDRVNLVVPNGAPHMWHAAMQNKSVRLTVRMMNADPSITDPIDFDDMTVFSNLEFTNDIRRQDSAKIEPEYKPIP